MGAGLPTTVREVLEELHRETDRARPLAYTTVMTVLDNLHRKGWLVRVSRGRAYVYECVSTREQHSASLMAQALADSSNPRTTWCTSSIRCPPDEARALRTLLGRARGSYS